MASTGCASGCTATQIQPYRTIFCKQAVCTCRFGVAATGNACSTDGMKMCASCDDGFNLQDGRCVELCESDETDDKVCCNGITYLNEGKAICDKCVSSFTRGACGENDCAWSGHTKSSCDAQEICEMKTGTRPGGGAPPAIEIFYKATCDGGIGTFTMYEDPSCSGSGFGAKTSEVGCQYTEEQFSPDGIESHKFECTATTLTATPILDPSVNVVLT